MLIWGDSVVCCTVGVGIDIKELYCGGRHGIAELDATNIGSLQLNVCFSLISDTVIRTHNNTTQIGNFEEKNTRLTSIRIVYLKLFILSFESRPQNSCNRLWMLLWTASFWEVNFDGLWLVTKFKCKDIVWKSYQRATECIL